MVPKFARGLNMLLVDSDTTSLMYLASMLEQYSYKVTTTELASVALSLIQEQKDLFKLVIANVNMADMDSLSFLRALIEMEIPVILMASERNETTVRKALAEGACLFLKKPISFHDLKYVWQPVFKNNSNNPLMDETLKPEQEMESSYQSARVNIVNHEDKQILEGSQAFPVDENSVKESQNDENRKQGEFIKGNRSLEEDKGENEEGKRRKLNTDNLNSKNANSSEEVGKETNENAGSYGEKRTRRTVWTPELHLKFIAALSALSDKTRSSSEDDIKDDERASFDATPVASHLQKYKSQVKQISDNITTDLPSTCKPSSTIYATGSLSTLKSYEFVVVSGITKEADIVQGEYTSGSSSKVLKNEGKSPIGFSNGINQEMNAIEVPKPPTVSDLPASSVNQNKPLFEYADLMKLLGEDEEELKAGLGGGPNPGDLDRYHEWLKEALKET